MAVPLEPERPGTPTARMIGMYVWGGVTIVIAFGILIFVLFAGLRYMGPAPATEKFPYVFIGAPRPVVGLFFALTENGSVIAGILGFSGLAWSHFYKAAADAEVAQLKGGGREPDSASPSVGSETMHRDNAPVVGAVPLRSSGEHAD